jgi:NAD(P)-dependent dehydrogenase (short-subunit alcohol dehydrogenase family)
MTSPPRIVVVGGSGAVGSETCRLLTARGAEVAFTFHRNEEAARMLVDETGATPRRVDLTDVPTAISELGALADTWGAIDAVVCCAALRSTCEPAVAEALDEDDWAGFDRMMQVNVRGPVVVARALAPRFGEGGGNIVLLGSINGLKPVPTPAPYAASKAAVIGVAQALAKELGPRRILVNVVAPGILDSGASETLREETRAQYLKHSALTRFGAHREVAEQIAFLALSNTYITGQSIVLDGGL